MLIVCPVCKHSNPVIDGYRPGSILACRCGQYLEFVREGEPPRLFEKRRSAYPVTPSAPRVKPEEN